MNLCNRNEFLKDEFSIIIFQRLSYAIVVNINDGIKSCKLPTSIFYVEDIKNMSTCLEKDTSRYFILKESIRLNSTFKSE